jgi:hypothetical protein
VGACAHRLGDATGGSALDAGRASPDNARRSGPVLWPFIRRLALSAHDDRPGQLAERMTHGALRRGVLRLGAGHRRGGQRRATGALPRKRERARLPRHLRREPPHLSPPRRVTPQLVYARRARPAHPRESRPRPVGVARRRCALEAVEKVVTAKGQGAKLDTARSPHQTSPLDRCVAKSCRGVARQAPGAPGAPSACPKGSKSGALRILRIMRAACR